MATAHTPTTPAPQTMADILRQLGGVSPARVRWQPTPGFGIFCLVSG